MATEVLVPLYEVLVESIFGSIALAIVGMGMIFLLMLIIGKSSKQFLVYWLTFYIIVMASFYNTLFLLLAFIGAAFMLVRTLYGGI